MVYNIMVKFRGVAQLVARDIWDVEAAGSNPVTPTMKNSPSDGSASRLTGVFIYQIFNAVFPNFGEFSGIFLR